ncbi:MAG: hypothetical protein ACKVT0_23030 [Planctomycetaceae bacterium]
MSQPWSMRMSACVLSLILSSGCTKEPEHAAEAPPSSETKEEAAPVADPGTAEIPKGADSGASAASNESKTDDQSDGGKDQTPAQSSSEAATQPASDEAPPTKPSSTEESKTEVDDKEEEDE